MESNQTPTEQPPQTKKKFFLWVWVVAGAVVLLLITGGIYFYTKDNWRDTKSGWPQLTSSECEEAGGVIINTLEGESCPTDDVLGEVTNLRCPCMCCREGTVVKIDNTDTSNWQTYRNEEYGFEIKYPDIWPIEEQADIIVIGETPPEPGYGWISISISKELSSKWIENKKLNRPDGCDEPINTNISDKIAIKIICKEPFAGGQDISYLIEDNDKLYILNYYSGPPSFDDVIEEIINSFKFINEDKNQEITNDKIDCGILDYYDENSKNSSEFNCFQESMNKCMPAKIIMDKTHDNKRSLIEIKGLKNNICFWEETNLDNPLDKKVNCDELDEFGNYTKSINCPI